MLTVTAQRIQDVGNIAVPVACTPENYNPSASYALPVCWKRSAIF